MIYAGIVVLSVSDSIERGLMVYVSRRGHTVSIRLCACPVIERDVLEEHLSDLQKRRGCCQYR